MRVVQMLAAAEQQAQRLIEPGALKDGLFNLAADLKQMVKDHDTNTSQQAGA